MAAKKSLGETGEFTEIYNQISGKEIHTKVLIKRKHYDSKIEQTEKELKKLKEVEENLKEKLRLYTYIKDNALEYISGDKNPFNILYYVLYNRLRNEPKPNDPRLMILPPTKTKYYMNINGVEESIDLLKYHDSRKMRDNSMLKLFAEDWIDLHNKHKCDPPVILFALKNISKYFTFYSSILKLSLTGKSKVDKNGNKYYETYNNYNSGLIDHFYLGMFCTISGGVLDFEYMWGM